MPRDDRQIALSVGGGDTWPRNSLTGAAGGVIPAAEAVNGTSVSLDSSEAMPVTESTLFSSR